MKPVRTISVVLMVVTRITSIGYLLTFLLSCLALASGWSLNLIDKGNRFEIYYPFTTLPYLLGENNRGYKLAFLILLGLYAIFFFLTSKVFEAFTKKKLFTVYGIRQLRWFYLANLILPITAVIVIRFFYKIDDAVEILVVAHALLGIFAYFIAAIFWQGVKLQNEQDLII